jgi:RNA polymerase sigma-70 factor (ECF subfamily)
LDEAGQLFDDDSALAVRASRGDRKAFESLVEKYQGAVYNFTLHFFRSPDVAQDMTQETFLRAFRFLHTYDPTRRFITWIYSIARNICIDHHRERARKEHVCLEDVPAETLTTKDVASDPLRMLEQRESRDRLLAAVESLPEKYKTPVILCYLQGLSYQEISEILGISLNNTKIRIFRAKKMMMEQLDMAEDS